jgi:hypothetical protein
VPAVDAAAAEVTPIEDEPLDEDTNEATVEVEVAVEA